MPNIKELKKELNLNRKDLAKFFDMSDLSFANSTAKKRYEKALCMFYERIKKDFDLIPKEKNIYIKMCKHKEPVINKDGNYICPDCGKYGEDC